jgi:hypothetical protein
MRCNIEVDDLTSVMLHDYETVQVAEGQCQNGSKVECTFIGTVNGKFHKPRKVDNSFLGQTFSSDTAPFAAASFSDFGSTGYRTASAISNSESSQLFSISFPVRISIGALPARLPRSNRRWLCTYANSSSIP